MGLRLSAVVTAASVGSRGSPPADEQRTEEDGAVQLDRQLLRCPRCGTSSWGCTATRDSGGRLRRGGEDALLVVPQSGEQATTHIVHGAVGGDTAGSQHMILLVRTIGDIEVGANVPCERHLKKHPGSS